MAKLSIVEAAFLSPSQGAQVLQMPPTAEQSVDFTGGATQSAAFNAATNFVQLCSDTTCSVAFGTNPAATTTNMRLPADTPIVVGVQKGLKLSVVQTA
jgi:hypothetical protein